MTEPFPWYQGGSRVSKDVALKNGLRLQLTGFGLFTIEIQNFLYRKISPIILNNPGDHAKIHKVVKNVELDEDIAQEVTLRLGGRSLLIADVCRQLEIIGDDAEGVWISRDGPPFCWSRFKKDASDLNEHMHELHLGANGLRFKLRSGLLLGGRANFPFFSNGCRCSHRLLIPILE